jgi:XTP/dITP diphosphohydrolase
MLGDSVEAYSEVIKPFYIEENGDSFGENALIKARAIYEKLGSDYIVIADDSGISVPILGGAPGIYSARYAGEKANDRDNLNRLVEELLSKSLDRTPAYYTASIAIVSEFGEYTVHGWMHGDVISELRGDGGFGYDPIFIPEGYESTLGELDSDIKAKLSHRYRALELAKPIIEMLNRGK